MAAKNMPEENAIQILTDALEHYAADATWDATWGADSDTAYLKYYAPNAEGFAVAREALEAARSAWLTQGMKITDLAGKK